jgi:predicted nucleotidyltransferase
MLDSLRRVLEAEPGILYAVLFGSTTRGTRRPDSDVDVALELAPGVPRDVRALGRLAARLESAAGGRGVDLILLDEAPPALAYRIFRDGRLLVERDHRALIARKTRAVLDYLDFKPVEDRCAAAVLRAAAGRGR